VAESRVALSSVEYEAPADELETQVAAVIAEVLNIDQVGRRDSFYDLGGASLTAIRICARIERSLGRRIDPTMLLDHDELADFVKHIRFGAG
jgi:acyl carrier protein